MPYKKYFYLKQAVDYEMLRQRKLLISDTASAFSDPQKAVRHLEQQESRLASIYSRSQKSDSSNISWEFNSDAANQLKKWQR